MKRLLYFLIILLIPFAFSCKHGLKEKESFNAVFSTYKSDTTKKNGKAPKNEIFYGILTPVEICTIFNRLGITYNNATLNPISNRISTSAAQKLQLTPGYMELISDILRCLVSVSK